MHALSTVIAFYKGQKWDTIHRGHVMGYLIHHANICIRTEFTSESCTGTNIHKGILYEDTIIQEYRIHHDNGHFRTVHV